MNHYVNSQKRINKTIETEYLRQKLASSKDYEKLSKMYSCREIEIPNSNTSNKWNLLNKKEILFQENPMAYDRIVTISKLINSENSRLLDIGFGQGALIKAVSAKLKLIDIWGVDIAHKSVQEMRKKYKSKKWKFIEGKIADISLPNEYFDYVTAMEVLEHIEPHNILKVLKKIHKTLKLGAKLVVSVPLNEGLEDLLKRGENPNAHTRIYSPELIKSELLISGFEIESSKLLFAFGNNYYIKSMIARLASGIRKPNNIILTARKK